MIARIVSAVLDRPLLTAGLWVALLALALVGATRLRLDFASTSFYGDDEQAVADLVAYQEQWGPDDAVLLVVASAREGDVLTPARLQAIAALSQALSESEQVVSVRSVATLEGPDGRSLSASAPTGETARALWKRALLAQPALVPLLLSEDGQVTAIAVTMRQSSDDLGAVVPAVAAIEAVVERHQGAQGLDLALAGVPAVRAGFFELTLRDQMRLQPVMVVLIGLGLWLVFRRVHGVLAPGLAAGIPMLLLVGVMGFFGEPVGLINQAYFTLIPVLAVADAVHLVSRYQEEARADGPGRPAIVRAARQVGLACLLTTLTTAAGFGSLAAAGMPVLRRFGLFAALGMVLAYAAVLCAVPLVLRAVGSAPPPRAIGASLARRVGEAATARPWWVMLGAALVCAGMGLASARVVVDNRLTDLLEPEHPAHRASDVVDQRLGGILSLEIDLRAAPGRLAEPAVLDALGTLEAQAREQPGVRAVLGPGGLSRVRDESPLREVLDDARGRARISIRVAEPGGRAFEALADDIDARAHALLDPLGVEPTITGTTLVAYRGVNRITGDLRTSLLLVFAVVTALILILFRSPRLALISLIPNALPLLIGYGCVALLGWTLDPLAAVVLTLALGVAVDDTIHVMMRTREGLRAGLPIREAVIESLAHAGRAVLVTSLLISAGLAVNLLSSFPPLQMLGLLGAIEMLSALACDLLLLPALLVVVGPRTPPGSVSHDASAMTRMS